MKRVTQASVPQVQAMLEERPHLAMFPLANLARHGLDGAAPRAPMMWTDGRAVLTVTREGMVFPFGPTASAGAMAGVLAGRQIIGIIGAADIARAVQRSAGLVSAPAKLDRDEPQFNLALDRLQVPDGPGALIPLADAPRALMDDWRVAYDVEALGEPVEAARARGPEEIDSYLVADSHRVLVVDGRPVCLTGLNAALPQIVQVGGVYTPPDLRGRGFARRAVARHLRQVRAQGVTQATLFASGPSAVRAYEAIGFEQVGDWTLLLFKDDGVMVHD